MPSHSLDHVPASHVNIKCLRDMKRQGASENWLDLPIPDGDVRGYKSQAGFVLGKLDVTITTYLKHLLGDS